MARKKTSNAAADDEKKGGQARGARLVPDSHPLAKAMDDAAEGLKAFRADPYSFTLLEWFELETWEEKEALLLLSNICPTGADVEWGYENFAGVWINEPQIHNAQILTESDLFYIIPHERGAVPFDVTKEATRSHAENEILHKRSMLAEAEEALSRAFKIWASGEREKRRFPPAYYVEWAVGKNIDVPWLAWAQANELIEKNMKPAKESATERRQRLMRLRSELIAGGVKDFNCEISRREGISVTRVKQLLAPKK